MQSKIFNKQEIARTTNTERFNIICDILQTDKYEPYNPLIIGYGGSISYGTNTPESDTDIRGVVANTKSELLGLTPDRETICFSDEDTTLYTLKKALILFSQCNPNTIELLGLRSEHYLYLTPEGKMILDNKSLFLSQRAIFTFGAYAKSQLNRLTNKSAHDHKDILVNEQRSLTKVIDDIKTRYDLDLTSEIKDNDILININNATISISELTNILNELNNVERDYRKRSKRNDYAIAHNKLAKHQMHLFRLYLMGIDVLNGEIITYREKEHDLLMSIRNGDFLKNDKPTDEFFKILSEKEKEFEAAAGNTKLPKQADMDKINELAIKINTKLLEKNII